MWVVGAAVAVVEEVAGTAAAWDGHRGDEVATAEVETAEGVVTVVVERAWAMEGAPVVVSEGALEPPALASRPRPLQPPHATWPWRWHLRVAYCLRVPLEAQVQPTHLHS